jgi:hypothetical protein
VIEQVGTRPWHVMVTPTGHAMQVTPAPSASRGEPTLQPAYFTSSLFVHPLREDILALIHLFLDQYTQRYLERPYALFKEIWCSQGWHWFHFKVLDARSRDAFLNVTMRLFLGACIFYRVAL